MRFLCLSDIHGHVDALSAVLAEAEKRGYDAIFAIGDHCFPGPDPLLTWRRLTQIRARCAQGSSDRALAMLDPDVLLERATDEEERERAERFRTVRESLGQLVTTQLARLPTEIRQPLPNGSELLVIHGRPTDPLEPLTADMSDDELIAALGDDPADIVVCGGSHTPFQRTVGNVLFVGVGSVGEAVYQPERFADATILTINEASAEAESLLVPLGMPTVEHLSHG